MVKICYVENICSTSDNIIHYNLYFQLSMIMYRYYYSNEDYVDCMFQAEFNAGHENTFDWQLDFCDSVCFKKDKYLQGNL